MSSKVFVGSLPPNITDAALRSEFSKYGQVEDVFVKPGCEPSRQWAFITFASNEQAQHAKESCDRVLQFPGALRPCDVMLAKNQGMFGQQCGGGQAVAPVSQGPKKIFVGSLPDGCTEDLLRAEFCKFGHIMDVYVKSGCEAGRQWAFVTFNSSMEAQMAKEACDRILVIPGSDRPCEVTLARNQGLFGQDALNGGAKGGGCMAIAPMAMAPMAMAPMGMAMAPMGGQPPPPASPPPAHLTPWRLYKTAAGLPYYHNHTTGVTQWECPPELQTPGQGAYGAGAGGGGYRPY